MPKIPVLLITGFLGSGKTSFLGEYLSTKGDKSTALIINELGQIALDQRILKSSVSYADEQMLYLNSGCVCCNKRLDLVNSLKSLLDSYDKQNQKLGRVIIETTGLANPAPILWTLLSDVFLSAHFATQGVIACVDAMNGFLHLENNEARQQIIFADSVLLTKTDLQGDTQALKAEILALNPSLSVFDKAKVRYDELFSHANKANFRAFETSNSHEQGFETLALGFDGAVEWSAFGIWLSLLLQKHGTRILRVKGILDIGEDFLVSINGAMHIIHPPTHIKKDKENGSKLVFITRNLPKEQILHSLDGFKGLLGAEFKILS